MKTFKARQSSSTICILVIGHRSRFWTRLCDHRHDDGICRQIDLLIKTICTAPVHPGTQKRRRDPWKRLATFDFRLVRLIYRPYCSTPSHGEGGGGDRRPITLPVVERLKPHRRGSVSLASYRTRRPSTYFEAAAAGGGRGVRRRVSSITRRNCRHKSYHIYQQ